MVPQTQTVSIPHVVEKRVPVTYTRRTPRTVVFRIPIDPCTGEPLASSIPSSSAVPSTVARPESEAGPTPAVPTPEDDESAADSTDDSVTPATAEEPAGETSEADGPAIPGVPEDDEVPTFKEPVHRTPAEDPTDGSEAGPQAAAPNLVASPFRRVSHPVASAKDVNGWRSVPRTPRN
jgi:hypothetical protein